MNDESFDATCVQLRETGFLDELRKRLEVGAFNRFSTIPADSEDKDFRAIHAASVAARNVVQYMLNHSTPKKETAKK